MPPRTIRVLHVEDDKIQQKLVAHYFKSMHDFNPVITCVDNEEAAIQTVKSKGVDLVVLDYLLTRGDGLSCLREIRRFDEWVPVIAMSGAATPEIAAEFLRAGADEYLVKQSLSADEFVGSVRGALCRSQGLREAAPPHDPKEVDAFVDQFQSICDVFLNRLGADFWTRVDTLESKARELGLTRMTLQVLFDALCLTGTVGDLQTEGSPAQALRPLMLELLLRLFGDRVGQPVSIRGGRP